MLKALTMQIKANTYTNFNYNYLLSGGTVHKMRLIKQRELQSVQIIEPRQKHIKPVSTTDISARTTVARQVAVKFCYRR